ncbi:Na+/melibiose symporter-like transporter [Novosphingobium sp. PhB165]|uniref:MFS transporter n=1 Tax=Novosphingobium sp. PhB165 TaxID=2485105 RepID=UPI00104669FC|nr:MFS transporter [Novosphingobium sp. PhB165]TCM15741.1 Na+/melibiose symporter-like transporter [Novosphingobium sp. PhB165]
MHYQSFARQRLSQHQSHRKLDAWRMFRLNALAIPIFAAAQPAVAFVPAILARDYGIPLAGLGLVYLIGQIANSLLDPVIGALSDRTRSRFGRRRPWIAAGGLLFTLGIVMLFFPPHGAGLLWVSVGVFCYYAGHSITLTTVLAWSGEISGNYDDRTRISSQFTLLSAVALVLTLLLPAVADQLRPDDGPLRLTLFGTLILVTAVPALLLTLTGVPDRSAPADSEPFAFGKSIKAIFGNPLLLRVLAADAAVTAGQGVRTALLLFVITLYFHRPEWAAGFFLLQYAFGVLAGPIWQRIGLVLGKGRAAVLAEVAQAVINLGLVFLTPDRFGLMVFLAIAQGLTQSSGNLMLRSMVADIADLHRAETGEDRVGLYYSVFSVSMKLGPALAFGIALPLVTAFGFNPAAATNTPTALNGLLLVFALGPALGHALAAVLVSRFPLDASRHAEIRRQIEARDDVYAAAALVPAE